MEEQKVWYCDYCAQYHYKRNMSDVLKMCIHCKDDNYKLSEEYIKLRERELEIEKEIRRRDAHYRHNYNITIEDYNKLYSSQNGKCKICKTHQTVLKRALSVDHDHKTGKVRGLLCQACNTALGLMKENETDILNMIVYLKEFSDQNC